MEIKITNGSITEKDAKTQVCPMSLNREDGSWLCQGKDCMAWRWIGVDIGYKGHCGMVVGDGR